MLLWVVDFFNGKTKGRFDPQAAMLHDQCQMLEDASRQLMGEKRLVAGAVGLNLIKFAGIGSTEFVFTALFSGIVGTGLAGSASLLYRFGTFVFPFLVGAVVVIIRRIYLKKTGQAKR